MKIQPYTQRKLVLLSALLCTVAVPAWSQTVASPAENKNSASIVEPEKKIPVETVQKKDKPADDLAPKDEDILVMSPFEVSTTNRGYYAPNTMSGTRFNSKVEDLASSMTVMTKQQMTDFAMLDINDVFLYTASAQGTGTYTDLTIDRNGQVSDNVQLSPSSANRIRGLAPANVSYGNYELAAGRLPIDPLDIESLEISRGPNANVFGLGNPSGTVNMVPVSANLSRDKSSAGFRADNWGGYRTNLDVNRVLKNNVLAIRVNGAFQHEAFTRKPSGVNSQRYNGMIKYSPFSSTTISAGYKYYKMNGNRPNFGPPRDAVSYWANQGHAAWNPITQTYTLDNGFVSAPILSDTGLPTFLTRSNPGYQSSGVYVDQGAVQYWSAPSVSLSTTPISSASSSLTPPPNNTIRLVSSNSVGVSNGKPTTQPLFTAAPAVSDKAIYDWSSINLAAPNRVWDKTQIYTFQLDQSIFKTERQALFAQVGFLREDDLRYQRTPFGTAGGAGAVSGQLYVDVNKYNLDGTPNPFFGHPYIGISQPTYSSQPLKWDTYRGQFSYTLDFSQEKTLLKWLGKHQFSGYDEYKYRISRKYVWKDAVTSNNPWFLLLPAGTTRANQSGVTGANGQLAAPQASRVFYRYYVGDGNGYNVDYAPTSFNYGTFKYLYGNPTTGFVNEDTTLGEVGVSDDTGGANNTKTILKTHGAVLQSFFWDGKIVTTFGLRMDKQYVKNGNLIRLMNPDLMSVDTSSVDAWSLGDYRYTSGRTTTGGIVIRPLRDIGFLQRTAAEGGVLGMAAQAVQSLAYTYNKADSFIPADPRVDIFLNPLPNPHGIGKDRGLWMSIGDKITVRYNRFDTSSLAARTTDASTLAQRVTRTDVSSTANFLLRARATQWVTTQNPTWTGQQIADEVSREMGLSTATMDALNDAFNAGTLASTQDLRSKGQELEINFNPTSYWTVAASATDTKTINSNVSPAVEQWIAQRLPVWTTIVDPRYGTLWWKTRYGNTGINNGSSTTQTAEENYLVFIKTPESVIHQLDGKVNPQVPRYTAKVSTSLNLAGLTEQSIVKKFTVGGAIRWEDKSAIGYMGVMNDPTQPGIYTDLDVNQPVYTKARYYFDAFIRYRTKIYGDKIFASIQLNARNIQEGGRLQTIAIQPDGTPSAYRIVDPRQYTLTVSFDL